MILSSVVFLALASTPIGSSGIDPIDNYCWRLDHQSTVKNGTLYIDGGVEVFVGENHNGAPKGDQTLGYSTSMIAVDMSSSWDWKMNISITALNKTANTDTGTDPPLVVDAALYPGPPSDSNIYLYGGTASYVNTSFPGYQAPGSSQYALWSYDTTADAWGQYDVTIDAPSRPAGGAYAEAPDQGRAFWLNGYINNGTSNELAGWNGFLQYLGGLVVIDTNAHMATNYSTSSLDDFPRVKGGLTYLPDIGSNGILVSLGGVTKPTTDTTDSNQGSYVSFNEINILDLASLGTTETGTWHTQKATGDIPSGRTSFCTVAASAKDSSSHNIYIYGGQDANQIYDQIYVLSIPSFTWTRVYEGRSPRYGHTCHLVGNRQMLTVGGSSTNDLLTACDWETKGVGVFDLSDSTWGSVFDAQAGEYEVPAEVYRVIGGDANGNASMKEPSNSFSSPEVSRLFNTATNYNASKTSKNEKNTISGGDIAGAVVGSVAGAALIAGLAFFFWRERQNAAKENLDMETEETSTMPTGMNWRNQNGWTVELPDTHVQPKELQSREIYEAPENPVLRELVANEVRHELPGDTILQRN